MNPKDISAALDRWFDAGHSRFTLILTGSRAGCVLIAHNRHPEPAEIIERQVISGDTGEIVKRIERPLPLALLAQDPDNGPALIQAVESRLAGAIAPPPICPRTPGLLGR